MLTRKQMELLMYIDTYLKRHGIAPSFEEMKNAVDLKSKSGIHRLIKALEERGFLKRLPHRARALEVLRPPPSLDADRQDRQLGRRFRPSVIKGDFRSGRGAERPPDDRASAALPLYGRIAAGTPIEALRDETDHIDVPADMLGAGEHYALAIDGDSMVEAGILDGDTAVIERCQTAENGAIVVALVDDSEVTLKRLHRKGESIALEPANERFETRIFGPGRVKVQGRLRAILRRY